MIPSGSAYALSLGSAPESRVYVRCARDTQLGHVSAKSSGGDARECILSVRRDSINRWGAIPSRDRLEATQTYGVQTA